MLGQTVGKYRVVSRLGRGGMGTVYKAVDETLDREVAIKCLNPNLAEPEIVRRFRAEAVMLAHLNHPNIATLFELTEHAGDLLMVMEFVRGETFDRMSDRVGAMPVDRAAQLCMQVLDALEYAHRAGVVHRDLKPANLMLTEAGRAKVMDFGVARMSGAEHMTVDGYMVGTPAYMPPEQVLGGAIDGRADLYSMGVVLFRLLTAELPFQAFSDVAMAHKHINDRPTPIRQLREELPAECEEILARALAKAPGDRYQTADDFKAALAPLSGVSVEVTSRGTVSAPRPISESDPTLPPMPAPLSGTHLPAPLPPTLVLPMPERPGARRLRVGVAASLCVLLFAGVPATAMILWRARDAKVEAPASPVVLAAATAPQPKVEAPAPTPVSPVPAAEPKKSEPAPRRDRLAAKEPAPEAPLPAPTVTFANLKLLVSQGTKSNDRDASLRLGTDLLQVMDGGKTIESTPYRDIIGVFRSHSREPQWATPDGTAVPIVRLGSRFSFLTGVPDWITVRTKRSFIPLRVPPEDLGRLTAELETRIGTKIVLTR